MLKQLRLENVGPVAALDLALAPRINVFTGDNGLGKSFILDVAWSALTRTWRGLPALPTVNTAKAKVMFRFTGEARAKAYTSTFDVAARAWTENVGRPANPALVLYVAVDGGFAVWDPARNYWRPRPPGRPPDDLPFGAWGPARRRRQQGDPEERPAAYLFSPTQMWDGLTWSGIVLCDGLIRDWVRWQQSRSPEFEHLKAALSRLSPSAEESLAPGEPTLISLNDVREIPTLRMAYGQEVPVLHASAGMKRIISLAYLLVWAWHGHCRASKLQGQQVTRQIILLVDEVECHLHPKWQRTIMGALLGVMDALAGADKVDVQLLAATHSPLVLASLEPFFDPQRDAWFDIDLCRSNGKSVVEVTKRPWTLHGDASSWLTSEAFDLASAYSREAEAAIASALAAWRDPAVKVETIRTVHAELRKVLKDTDRFWPRWLYFAEKKGVEL